MVTVSRTETVACQVLVSVSPSAREDRLPPLFPLLPELLLPPPCELLLPAPDPPPLSPPAEPKSGTLTVDSEAQPAARQSRMTRIAISTQEQEPGVTRGG
jgi:hypothetical protein